MKKRGLKIISRIAVITAVLTSVLLHTTAQAAGVLYDLPSNMKISAKSAILVSLGATPEEDTVLYEKQPDSKRSPAALVRMMVGVTAIEIIRDKGIDIDKVTGKYSSEAFNIIAGTGLTTVQMQFGEEWTIRDLLSISMIQTAADACVTLAITLSGSHSQFVAEMNKLAKKIGCENTSFANVTGIDSLNQYTTVRDLYKIMRYAMDYPEYELLFAAIQHTCNPVSGGTKRTYATTNDMLRSTTSYYYSPMAFGKTGYTTPAGRCLASVARDSGYEYLCIVMGEPDTDEQGNRGVYFRDTRALYQWAFNNFIYEKLLDKYETVTQIKVNLAWDRDSVPLRPKNDVAAIVIKGLDKSTIEYDINLTADSVDAPITKGQVLGKVMLKTNVDQVIGEVDLIASESVERSQLLAVWTNVQTFLSSPWFFIGLALLALLLIGYFILGLVHNRKRRRRRYKSLKRYR
ncbi:MAG: hypothetical protein PHX02_03085 [Oscillospiraceae bacterium]|nr:hypothetical protein [Oscillospiraceae bacterium]